MSSIDTLPAVLCCAVCVPQAMKINAKMGGVNVKLLDNPERVSTALKPCTCTFHNSTAQPRQPLPVVH